jgi:hypothetical protein
MSSTQIGTSPQAADYTKASVNKIYTFAIATVANILTFQTILNITGKGYLKKCLLIGNSVTQNLRITIDGTETVLLTCPSSSASAFGILLEDLIAINASNGLNGVITNALYGFQNNVGSYPDTSNTHATIKLAQLLYFNTSLLIEVSCISTAGASGEYSYVAI